MRKSKRTTERYDYKVLNSIGTTEQDKHPLRKVATEDIVHNDDEDLVRNDDEDLVRNDYENLVRNDEEDLVRNDDKEIVRTDAEDIAPSNSEDTTEVSEENNKRLYPLRKTMDPNQLAVEEVTISEDIDDFFDENKVEDSSTEDYEALATRAEQFRSNYRGLHKQLQTVMGAEPYEEKYQTTCATKLELIKDYIKNVKHHKKKHHENVQFTKTKSELGKFDFMKKEFDSTCKELSKYFIKDDDDAWNGLSDEDLSRRRQELQGKEKIIHSLSNTVRDLVGTSTNAEIIKTITENYQSLRSSKNEYSKKLDEVVKNRELDQKKAFNRSKLNIKLPKFKGYSGIDVYSFKSRFEKLHPSSEVPKNMLPELVKNNFLENPALLLVKDTQDIDEIWTRLIGAYGDCKRLLSNKISELGEVEGICKSNDPEKVIDGLSKIINLMKDLMQLAIDHNLKQKLFHGDAVERIHGLMGESRFTRFLNILCDKTVSDEESQWKELLTFLEKEIKVNQQKILWSAKKKKEVPCPRRGSSHHLSESSRQQGDQSTNRRDSSHTQSETVNLKCHICNATDHVQTSGPNGCKLIQYFACKKFVDMTPEQRCAELISKNLCFQCLFPGANSKRGKHKEGKCQRDFICPHPSHSQYIGKKHVLVCEDHKTEERNKEVLNEYKRRFITRANQAELPAFTQAIMIHHNYIANDSSSDVERNPQPMSPSAVEFHPSNEEVSHAVQVGHPTEPSQQRGGERVLDDINEDAVYVLQTIKVNGEKYSIFFDGGCRKFVAKYDAIKRLGNRATLLKEGPIYIGGVGGMQMKTPHGIYQIKLPVKGGYEALISGTCMDLITEKFPMYPLDGKVEGDIKAEYQKSGGKGTLPLLEPLVGGDTHFMMGNSYRRYFPKEIFRMASGLTIFESVFENASGGYGVIGGNHSVFTEIERWYRMNNQGLNFIETQLQIYHCGYQVNPDVRLLGYQETYNDKFNCYDNESAESQLFKTSDDNESVDSDQLFKTSAQSQLRKFQASQFVGSEIQYRCPTCRNCQPCKDCDGEMTIREEIEQEKIEESIVVDIENRVVVAKIPLIADPKIKLCPNKDIARKVYNQQVKKLNKNQEDKESVIKSEAKLQELGYVDWVKNLPLEIQLMLANSPIQNFVPWLIAWKNSLTTPCRMVSHASMPTASGFSLNDCVAKGRNNLGKLNEIWIRWRVYPVAFHNDVNKMYNNVTLTPEDWCLQRYLFEPNLDPKKEPLEKVMKTAFYGVKSSGNQAECALRKTAGIFKDQYPEVWEVVRNDVYVDDCMSGEQSTPKAMRKMDELELVLNHGGFTFKACTISGQPPDKTLSSDGKTISVAGHKWDSEADMIFFDIKELNFAKKQRGRRTRMEKMIPEKLTKRICSSKIGEVFDFSGLIGPITGTFKLDLHQLVIEKLDWDDKLPENLRPIWEANFQLMGELKNLKYKRAVVPDDAVNLDLNTLDFGDASRVMVCVAIYVRFLRRCGSYSCQLILSKTRLVPEEMTQPRAELYAAVVNTHAGEIVRKALSKYHKKSLKFTDSQIALHWFSNDDKVLKQWVRSRCIEIRRFTDVASWLFVVSEDMIADIGTRPCRSINDVDADSLWYNGYEWMKQDQSQFPAFTVEEVKLTNKEKNEATKETVFFSNNDTKTFKETVRKRYEFSRYLIDPNRYRFQKVVRILAMVMKFIRLIPQRAELRLNSLDWLKPTEFTAEIVEIIRTLVTRAQMRQRGVAQKTVECTASIFISDEDLRRAETYFHRKATGEVRQFLNPNQYKEITTESNGVLHFTGRILPEDEVTILGRTTEVMKDLCSTTFCVPVTEKHSPIAFSLVSDIHWNEKSVLHSGIESTWRYVLKKMYVIDGRNLVKMIKNSCQRCRYLAKKALAVQMGPISRYNLTIAPAYYICQVDLAGPFSAYSSHNKRTTIKVWLVVICCTTTSATNIKVMESYATGTFLQAFTRFSCEVGYPKRVLVDGGSQLVKGCETMELSFRDLQQRLYHEVKVELELCPVGGHNMNGRVERKIKEVKKSLAKTIFNNRLGLLQWETVAASIANSINNLPLALGNAKGGFEMMDIITPNRLLLGRNNDRTPDLPLTVSNDYEKIISENEKIHQAWFECWLMSHVPKLIEQPKWFRSDHNLKKGDIVLFLKQESVLCNTYQYGMVESIEKGRDGKIRKVYVKYRNSNENIDRVTYRSTRSLVMIHPVDELNVMEELGQIAAEVDAEHSRDIEKHKCE